MGRKGGSKRKPSKSKAFPVVKINRAERNLPERPSEFRVPRTLDKGEAISISKDGEKASSGPQPNNKKR